MIIRCFLIVSICMQLSLAASIQQRDRHEPTISECAAKGGECDEARGRPVCGTDDQTYPTRCHLLRAQCSGHQVSLKYRGPCKACKEAREYALKHKSRNPPKFIPRCRADGTYAAIQCLGDTGCWCSDITGKPIENTSVRTGKPKCRKFNRANIRRSPARHLAPSRGRRACTHIERAAFNKNLIKTFQSEYLRSGQYKQDGPGGSSSTGSGSGSGSLSGGFVPPADSSVLDWKFAQLDVNGNAMLDKNEFRELKKLVKQAVKPRRCGRAFGKFCDVDNDDRLTRDEWNNCISKDGINRHSAIDHKNIAIDSSNALNGYTQHNSKSHSNTNSNSNSNSNNRHSLLSNHHQIHSTNSHPMHNTFHSNNNGNNNNNNKNTIDHNTALDLLANESNSDEDEDSSQHNDYDDYMPEEGDDQDNFSMQNIFGSSTNYPSIYFLTTRSESPLKDSEAESDCLSDQATALEEKRLGGSDSIYVPECTPDGRYQRVQCYRSTPYCWCVNEDTGKNIPGTSLKNKRPQCDSVYTVSRPMKGCPEPRKTIFLKDLKEFLKDKVLANANSGGNTTKWNSEDERIATLSFVLLDKNKNKAWERKEWKTFRELVTNSKTLRKCGKKMPRYCDANGDKKITLSEWLNCLQTQRPDADPEAHKTTQANESVSKQPSRLTGSNPLEQYLKD